MRKVLATVAVLATLVLFLDGGLAGEKSKEVKLSGTITCAKCDLKLQKSCATVLVTKKDGKQTIYYFDQAGNKKHHGKICREAMEGTVTGTVSTKGKKNIITVKTVEFK